MSWWWRLGSRGPGRCRPAPTTDCSPKTPQWSWHTCLSCMAVSDASTQPSSPLLHWGAICMLSWCSTSLFSILFPFSLAQECSLVKSLHVQSHYGTCFHRKKANAQKSVLELKSHKTIYPVDETRIALYSDPSPNHERQRSAAETVRCHLRSKGTKVFLLKRRGGSFK